MKFNTTTKFFYDLVAEVYLYYKKLVGKEADSLDREYLAEKEGEKGAGKNKEYGHKQYQQESSSSSSSSSTAQPQKTFCQTHYSTMESLCERAVVIGNKFQKLDYATQKKLRNKMRRYFHPDICKLNTPIELSAKTRDGLKKVDLLADFEGFINEFKKIKAIGQIDLSTLCTMVFTLLISRM
jgi:hypothetical protein